MIIFVTIRFTRNIEHDLYKYPGTCHCLVESTVLGFDQKWLSDIKYNVLDAVS